MLFRAGPGLFADAPLATTGVRWANGYNVRWRNGMPETVGLWRKLLDLLGNPIMTQTGTNIGNVRTMLPTSRGGGAQVIMGSRNKLYCLQPDAGSTISTGTRWQLVDITPAGLTIQPDTILPDLGRTKIGPFWWIVEFGKFIICGRAGVFEYPYVWDRDATHLPTALTNAPRGAVGAVVTENAFLVLLGCEPINAADPAELCVRWASQGKHGSGATDFTPSDITSAGDQIIRDAGRLMGGMSSSSGTVCWTDKDLRSIVPTYDTKIFIQVKRVATKCGLFAQNGYTESDGKLWWVGSDKQLWTYEGGRPMKMPCTVRAATFDRIVREGAHRLVVNSISEFDEVAVWCPTTPNYDPTVAATFNYRDQCWSIWNFARTCMCDRLGVMRPLAVGLDGTVYEHETTVIDDSPSWSDDPPDARSWLLESGHFAAPGREGLMARTEPYRIVTDLQRVHWPTDTSSVSVKLQAHEHQLEQVNDTEEIVTRTDTTAFNDVRQSGQTLTLSYSGTDRALTRFGDIHLHEQEGARRP